MTSIFLPASTYLVLELKEYFRKQNNISFLACMKASKAQSLLKAQGNNVKLFWFHIVTYYLRPILRLMGTEQKLVDKK